MTLPIHKACIIGNKSVLKKILLSISLQDLEAKDESGKTPLMHCILYNHLECATLLLKAGVHVDNSDNSGQTALHIAANKGFHRCTKLLLSHNSSCLLKDFYGVSPLHLAAIHSNSKGLAMILRVIKPGEIDIQDSSKKTALHWSCAHSNVESTKLLLMKEANMCIPDEGGKTPLHWTVINENPQALECAKVLLVNIQKQAKETSLVNWQDYEGRSALHLAVATGSAEIVRFLACRNDCNIDILDHSFCTPLHWAARKGLHDKADILLNRRASFESADGSGATPLHYAAYYNHAKTVSFFLSRNYVSDFGDKCGRNSFLWAAAQNAVDVLKILAENAANVESADNDGRTALHIAAQQGHVSAVEFLLQMNVNIDIKDKYGMTPLLRACEAGKTSAAQVLINHGAYIHAKDANNSSTLHWCTFGGHAYLCQILLQKSAQLNFQDDFGMTPLHYACMKEASLNCVSVLLESDCNPNILDMKGKTPLHHAVHSGNRNIVRLLCEYEANVNALVSKKNCWSTPLDLANNNVEIKEILRSYGGLKYGEIQDIAAAKIQSWYKAIKKNKIYHLIQTEDIQLTSRLGDNLAFLKKCQDVVDAYQMTSYADRKEDAAEFNSSLEQLKLDANMHNGLLPSDEHNLKNTLQNYKCFKDADISIEINAVLVIQRFLRKFAMKRKFQRMRTNIRKTLTDEERTKAELSWHQKLLLFHNQL